MARSLDTTTALVTGGARRIGRAICLALARAGADVVVHARTSVEDALGLCHEIESVGRSARVVTGDLSAEGGPEHVFSAAEAGGPIHLLVNNAAIYPRGGLAELTAGALDACHRVNAVAPQTLTRLLAESGHGEAVVNLLDARMLAYDALHLPYQLSKATLHALTKLAALEYAPRIRVNGVAPGLILPPPGMDDSFLERHRRSNPLETWGSPDAVAEAVIYLLTAEFVTGQVIFVDGGRHLRGEVHG
ncbi:MAG: SDR family oxidoreductase [Armatimonadetes bacterium]|jgi:NAD(P)-dependent dehydrogenase (short-subunit alcohol dehydrogenase family)|nr:SDR family oxidoreductase [Armatimonadota bacterium]